MHFLSLEGIVGVGPGLWMCWLGQAWHLSRIQVTSGLAGLEVCVMYLKVLFRDQALLEGREKKGLIIVTVVTPLCRQEVLCAPPPRSVVMQQSCRLLLCPSSLSAGSKKATPKWCQSVLECGVLPLPPLLFPLKTTLMSQCLFRFRCPGLQLLIHSCPIL